MKVKPGEGGSILAVVGLLCIASTLMVLQRLRQEKLAKANREKKQQKKKSALGGAVDALTPRRSPVIIEIEYCTGCRWMLRAAWLAQELLTTFQDELTGVTLLPNNIVGGTFEVRAISSDKAGGDGGPAESTAEFKSENVKQAEKRVLWSRKAAGRFPDSKELKQLVRDVIAPEKHLGHSDKQKSS